ncbi:hypothetical protein KAR26_01305 [Candidatus Parcubacteria bacterium]|nr:hypothetical protein [Candidatus Parcubacteria bacterium]
MKKDIEVRGYKEMTSKKDILKDVEENGGVGISYSGIEHCSLKYFVVVTSNKKAVMAIEKIKGEVQHLYLPSGICEFTILRSDVEKLISEIKQRLEEEFTVKIISKEKISLKTPRAKL